MFASCGSEAAAYTVVAAGLRPSTEKNLMSGVGGASTVDSNLQPSRVSLRPSKVVANSVPDVMIS
jgi:hypothetical protein